MFLQFSWCQCSADPGYAGTWWGWWGKRAWWAGIRWCKLLLSTTSSQGQKGSPWGHCSTVSMNTAWNAPLSPQETALKVKFRGTLVAISLRLLTHSKKIKKKRTWRSQTSFNTSLPMKKISSRSEILKGVSCCFYSHDTSVSCHTRKCTWNGKRALAAWPTYIHFQTLLHLQTDTVTMHIIMRVTYTKANCVSCSPVDVFRRGSKVDLPVLHMKLAINAWHLGVVGPLAVGTEICTDSANTQRGAFACAVFFKSDMTWFVYSLPWMFVLIM